MIFERGFFDSMRVNESKIQKSLSDSLSFDADSTYSNNTTIFLSHKHTDLEDLKGVVGMLEYFDVKLYIDSMDNSMPKQTNSETESRIKKVINYCDKLILLATDKAIESYWCNWELGIGDVHKFNKNNIAILPIKEKGSYNYQYKGNEYLQIYPQIDYEDGKNRYVDTNGVIERGYYFR